MGCGFVCSCGEHEVVEEEQFFDTREDISSASDSCPESPGNNQTLGSSNSGVSLDQQYNVWIEGPVSIQERRNRFRKEMGLSSPSSYGQESLDHCMSEVSTDADVAAHAKRLASDSGTVLGSSESLGYGVSLSGRFLDSFDTPKSPGEATHAELLTSNHHSQCDFGSKILNDGSSKNMETSESWRILQQTSSVQDCLGSRENSSSGSTSIPDCIRRSRRFRWLKRLGITSRAVHGHHKKEMNVMCSDSDHSINKRSRRVKVYPSRKRSKEFSALFMGQDIKAHDGRILTMKFSPDGKYLASGGEDGVVRVWNVIETGWTDEGSFPEEDPSCIYFMADRRFQLKPIFTTSKEKKWKSSVTKRTSVSACIVIPPDIFQISDKPLHEFHGHTGDILDLSWSKNQCLLTSSMDKTVRLWQVGCENCVKVFLHNDYVTCVQFNPMEEQYFISGSIDGKVRIWDISGCHVVEWLDIKEIISAICYQPDGKEIVVGCITGICRFYKISADNHIHLGGQISLNSKKKILCKKITGFQFSPTDSHKLMITCADSQIIILNRLNVVCKYKGLKNTGSQISASFTSDGRHIISASEDSNVYVWNHVEGSRKTNHIKHVWSSERFYSSNVSVAIPWMEYQNRIPITSEVLKSQQEDFRQLLWNHESHLPYSLDCCTRHQPTPGGFSLSPGFLSEYLSRGTATWPEEKLLTSLVSTPPPTLSRSQYKFLRCCCRSMVSSPHAWGQVIVTAGYDGRIRSFCNYGLPIGN